MHRTLSLAICLAACLAFLTAPAAAQTAGDNPQLIDAIEKARTSLDVDALNHAHDLAAAETQQHPNDARAFYLLGRVNAYRSDAYMNKGDKKNAEHALDDAIAAALQSQKLDDKSADTHSLLADCYGRKIGVGSPMFAGPKYGPKCAAENQRALELDPNNARAHASQGRQFLQAPKMFGGDVDKAIASFRKSLELDPKSDETYVWLAMALRKKGDTAGADQALQQALQLNPQSAFAKKAQAQK
jgi:tetratricopeptide (TPR) repeat protein